MNLHCGKNSRRSDKGGMDSGKCKIKMVSAEDLRFTYMPSVFSLASNIGKQ